MKTFSALCLLSLATLAAAPAQAAESASADCITLSNDQQIVRKGASSNLLLRNGSEHYIVHFKSSCASAALSRKLEFVTPGNEGQLCGANATKLLTKDQTCAVASVEPISADDFASRARARR